MEEQSLNDVWQVDVNGAVYEAPFAELGDWIDGGSLQPDDKVRKGNLRWIEARKVPNLVPFFNAKAAGEPMPVLVSTIIVEPSSIDEGEPTLNKHAADHGSALDTESLPPSEFSTALDLSTCLFHVGTESIYVCVSCNSGFCKTCPRSFGGTVRVCPKCGAFCREKREVQVSGQKAEQLSKAIEQGFGLSDFLSAFAYPFRFKVSLLLGAILFMVLTLGKGAGGLGGIFMVVGGVFSGMSANALSFGVLAHTINNFIQGKFDDNFMPDFDDFSLWDDVIHPFFLSIAAYVSSFGPFILILTVGFYLVTSSVNNRMDAYKSDLERIPGTDIYAGRELADQSGDVKDVLRGIDQRQRDRLDGLRGSVDPSETDAVTSADTPTADEDAQRQELPWTMAKEDPNRSRESVLGRSADTRDREGSEMLQAFLGLAAPIVVIGSIAFLWGLFLFPATCMVAGYSRSFTATINPLVALDTIRRLKSDYVKILAIALTLGVLSLVVGGILGTLLKAFDLPVIGNLPASAFGAIFTFYFSVVFSCVLGFALYKSADKLGLAR